MITFFVGTPGSGKSYEAVKKIIDNLRSGRTVCTNIEGMEIQECQEYLRCILDMDDFTFRQRLRILDTDQVVRFWQKEKILDLRYRFNEVSDVFEDVYEEVHELICPAGSLIVIDEVHKHFNARDWQDKKNRDLADWASTHRHHGYDLILITQNIDKVDKQVRTLTEWSYFFRKVNYLGSLVKSKYTIYGYSGDSHDGKSLTTNTHTYNPEYFPCYKSYATSDAKEIGFMTHVNILKHPIFYAIPVLLVFVLYMFFNKSSFASGDLFGVSKVQHKFDNVKTQGMQKSALPSRSEPMKNISSSQMSNIRPESPQVAPGVIPVVSDYIRYNVTGFITDGKTTVIQINGISVRLPSPHVQEFNRSANFAIAKSSIYGQPVQQASSIIPSLPVKP